MRKLVSSKVYSSATPRRLARSGLGFPTRVGGGVGAVKRLVKWGFVVVQAVKTGGVEGLGW